MHVTLGSFGAEVVQVGAKSDAFLSALFNVSIFFQDDTVDSMNKVIQTNWYKVQEMS